MEELNLNSRFKYFTADNLLVSLLLIAYFYIGLNYSSKQGFWHDEIYTLTFLKGVSTYEFSENVWSNPNGIYNSTYFKNLTNVDNYFSHFSTQIVHEGHPPLYFIFLKIWTILSGTTELGLRSFSLLCGVIFFKLIYSIIKTNISNSYLRVLFFILILSNPFLFYFFNEARMYGFALLIAAHCFLIWIKIQKGIQSNRDNYVFIFASLCLLYTHYHSIFFLITLAILHFHNSGLKKIHLYIIPIILFLPWFFVIQKQLILHKIHWTNGAAPFIESFIGYAGGCVSLFTFQNQSPQFTAYGFVIILIVGLLLFLFSRNLTSIKTILIALFFYFFQLYLFDKITNHHTILIARYYCFTLLFIYYFLFNFLFSIKNKLIPIILCSSISLYSFFQIYKVYQLQSSPKQMLREVAYFIDTNYNPKDYILVCEPKGPLTFGISYYLNKNYTLLIAGSNSNFSNKKPIYIDEMLGDPNTENKLDNTKQLNKQLIPFVGIFLYQ